MTTSLSAQPSSFESYVVFQRLTQDVSNFAANWHFGITGFEFLMPPVRIRNRVVPVNITGLTIPEETLLETRQASIYHPHTDLGRRLWAIRERIVASGEPLLSWEALERELAERRGE